MVLDRRKSVDINTRAPKEMEEVGYLEVPMDPFADEIWMVEEHVGREGRQVHAVKSL